ncbi:hypothetical protein A33M_2843 [Rhodovulum sp. PH10]|nr:hypothetical protein A33M_2843 [Rhodovulum sp. PH10]
MPAPASRTRARREGSAQGPGTRARHAWPARGPGTRGRQGTGGARPHGWRRAPGALRGHLEVRLSPGGCGCGGRLRPCQHGAAVGGNLWLRREGAATAGTVRLSPGECGCRRNSRRGHRDCAAVAGTHDAVAGTVRLPSGLTTQPRGLCGCRRDSRRGRGDCAAVAGTHGAATDTTQPPGRGGGRRHGSAAAGVTAGGTVPLPPLGRGTVGASKAARSRAASCHRSGGGDRRRVESGASEAV